MDEWIDFPWIPYTHTDLFDIVIEALAVLFGILSVVFSQRANIWTYPTGITSTSIYIYLTLTAALYGDMIINIYQTGMSLYGWYMWTRKGDDKQPLPITFSNKRDYVRTGILFIGTILFSVIIYYFSGKLKQGYAWADIFTTGVFFAGMYQMAIKKVESWIFWILGNIVSVPLYLYKDLALTSIQFTIFIVLAIMGYRFWKKKAKEHLRSPNPK